MELSAQEVSIIEKGRTKVRTAKLKVDEVLASKTRKAINEVKENIAKSQKSREEMIETKRAFLTNLKDVGDFKLFIGIDECSETPSFRIDGEWTTLDAIHYDLKSATIRYVGETLEETNRDGDLEKVTYTVSIEEHTTKSGGWSVGSNQGYKMSVNGLQYCSNQRSDFGKRITRAKKVMSLIQEDIENRKGVIQRKLDKTNLKKRALVELTAKYVGAKITNGYFTRYRTSEHSYVLTFENSIQVNVGYRLNSDGTIDYSVEEITSETLNGLDLVSLLGKL